MEDEKYLSLLSPKQRVQIKYWKFLAEPVLQKDAELIAVCADSSASYNLH